MRNLNYLESHRIKSKEALAYLGVNEETHIAYKLIHKSTSIGVIVAKKFHEWERLCLFSKRGRPTKEKLKFILELFFDLSIEIPIEMYVSEYLKSNLILDKCIYIWNPIVYPVGLPEFNFDCAPKNI